MLDPTLIFDEPSASESFFDVCQLQPSRRTRYLKPFPMQTDASWGIQARGLWPSIPHSGSARLQGNEVLNYTEDQNNHVQGPPKRLFWLWPEHCGEIAPVIRPVPADGSNTCCPGRMFARATMQSASSSAG